MALVTIQRSPSPSVEQDLDATDSSDDVADGRSQMRKRSRTSKQKLRKIFSSVRFISKLLRPGLSQSYFTVKGAALILPHNEFTKKSARKSHGGEIQHHLQAMLHLLRPEDTIKIAVRLEDTSQYQRYMALVSTKGRQDTEEAVILGIDCSNSQASIGLVLPVWMGLQITLGGDGGFSLHTDEHCYLFKPVSVQAMWSAIQSLVKVQHIADDMKYIRDGLSHTWIGYYRSRVDRRDSARVSQWNVEGVEVFAPSSLSVKTNDDERIKMTISHTLKEVMMTVDLDEATSLMLRKAVEEKMSLSLAEFKGYFDEEVMRILGQMDESSEILDFLYLGSEWNASNLDELSGKGIDYILNVTKEIDNFFEGRFHYYNVRVYDEDESDLLKHWDKTYKFISKARSQKSKVLVHCKMGVSRSASTVMAFMMKDRRWSVEEAFSFVKERRSCVHPNAGFMEQLRMYEGILTASNKRDIFRSKSDQNLLDEGAKDDLETPDMSFLGEDLFRMMSHSDWLSASESVAHGEEWIGSLYQDETHDTDMLQVGTDLETESRSADSMEEVLPDLPSPPPETAHELYLSLSLPSARPAFGWSTCDAEVAQEPKADGEMQSDKLSCSSDCQQTCVGSPTSRIKPDSSWIRLDIVDTEEQSTSGLNSKCMFTESVPCSDSHSSVHLNVGALDTSATDPHMAASIEPHKAAITEPHWAATEPHRTITEPHRAAIEPHRAITDLRGAAMESDWEAMDLQRASTDAHKAPTDSPRTLVSRSELLQLKSGEVSPMSPVSSTTVSEPRVQLGYPSSDVSFTGEANTCANFYIGNIQTSLNTAPTIPSVSIYSSCIVSGQKCSATSASSLHSVERSISHPSTDQLEEMVPSNSPVLAVMLESVDGSSQQALSYPQYDQTLESVDRSSQQALSYPHYDQTEPIQCSVAVLEDAEEVPELGGFDPAGSSSGSTSPHSRSDLGAEQYFFRENIPWKSEKVKKMHGDFNKIGHVSQDDETDESMAVDLCGVTQTDESMAVDLCGVTQTDDSMAADLCGVTQTTLLDVSSENQLLGQISSHPQATVLSHSHSRMELCTQEDEAMKSLYEPEKVTVTPGTVLRTKQEVEGRQRGEGDQELFDSSRPVLRLEHPLDTPHSKYTRNRRSSGPIMSLQEGESVRDVLSVGVGEIQQMDLRTAETSPPGHMEDLIMPELENKEIETMLKEIPSTIRPGEAPSVGLVSSPAEGNQVNFQTPDNHSSGDNSDNQHPPSYVDTQNQPTARGNMDSETLALIREIGSALLMSPAPPQSEEDTDESRPCSNMVRYFVRKIEQQTKIAAPSQETVVSSKIDEIRKTSSARGDASPGTLSGFSPIISPTRSRPLIDCLPTSAPCTALPSSNFNTQSRTAEGFSDTPAFQNSAHPGRISLDIDATSHMLVEASSPVLERKNNVLPQVLSLYKAEPAIFPGSEPIVSPCSDSRSFQHDSTEPSVVRHLVGRFEPKCPESDSSESGWFKDGHGSLSSPLPGDETGQKEGSSVPVRSLEDSSNHASVSLSQLAFTSSDKNVTSQPFIPSSFLPVTTSSSPHFLAFPSKHTYSVTTHNLADVVTAVSDPETLSSNTGTTSDVQGTCSVSSVTESSVASTTEMLSEGSATGSSVASATEMLSEGSATGSSVATATKVLSGGSATEVLSEGSATGMLSEGSTRGSSVASAIEMLSEGSATDRCSVKSATDTRSLGSVKDRLSVGPTKDTCLAGYNIHTSLGDTQSTTDTQYLESAIDTQSLGSATDTQSLGSARFVAARLLPTSNLERSHMPGRSKSACQVQFSASSSQEEPLASDALQARAQDSLASAAEFDVTMRQVSSEGRKIRRLHGKSHPLTKLAESRPGRGPFYNSM